MKRKTRRTITDEIKDHLSEMRLTLGCNSCGDTFVVWVTAREETFPVALNVVERARRCLSFTLIFKDVQEENKRDIMEFVLRTNPLLPRGRLVFDLDEGSVLFECTESFEQRLVKSNNIEQLIDHTVQQRIILREKLRGIVDEGLSPKEATASTSFRQTPPPMDLSHWPSDSPLAGHC